MVVRLLGRSAAGQASEMGAVIMVGVSAHGLSMLGSMCHVNDPPCPVG